LKKAAFKGGFFMSGMKVNYHFRALLFCENINYKFMWKGFNIMVVNKT